MGNGMNPLNRDIVGLENREVIALVPSRFDITLPRHPQILDMETVGAVTKASFGLLTNIISN